MIEPAPTPAAERATISARLLPAALVALLVAYGFAALDRYNVTWDEALGDLFFGQRYLSFWTSFDTAYLDFEADPYPPDHRPDLRASAFRSRPWEHYPVGATTGALVSWLTADLLGVLDPYDGYHAANLLFAGLLLWVLWSFLGRRYGPLVASVAAVLLFVQPRVFAHLMANIKDFPLMVVYALAVIAFLSAYERGSTLGLLGAGALWGVAMGTKANGLFLPATPAALVVVDLVRRRLPAAWKGRARRLLLTFAGMGVVGPLVWIVTWPYLWADPLARLGKNLSFIFLRRGTTRPESMAPVLEAIVLTTPLLVLALAALGVVAAVQRARRGDRAAVLLLVWIPSVLARYLAPSAVNYDGVRHFLEIFPPLAALAGLGVGLVADGLVRWLARRGAAFSRRSVHALAAVLVVLPAATTLLATHPFELAYWNRLAGGLAGAQARGLPQAGDYWGASYRLGLEWLDEHAEPDSFLAVPVIEHAVRLVAPERLRPDITLLGLTSPFSPAIPAERLRALDELARERTVYVMFVDRRDWINPLMAHQLRFGVPEVTWQLDDVPVLRIDRYRSVGPRVP